MREIQFRGKVVGCSQWVYGSLLKIPHRWGTHYVIYSRDHESEIQIDQYGAIGVELEEGVDVYESKCMFEVDPDTIGQYTGLKDSEGREIYEGDILVLVPDGCIKHIVSWNKQEAAFNVVSWGIHRARIIGNIHDNPELLEL